MSRLLEKIRYFLSEVEEKEAKKEKAKKIVLSQNRSKVIIHPPLKEDVADTGKKVLTQKDLEKAVNFPEGVLADPKAPSSWKDFAFQILQLRIGNI